jgi:hypothetical protein
MYPKTNRTNPHPGNPPAPPPSDPIDDEQDPTVKSALSKMANKIRERAHQRAKALQDDLRALICDFIKEYPDINASTNHYAAWKADIEKMCRDLGAQVAEADVRRHVKTLSDKILELDSK